MIEKNQLTSKTEALEQQVNWISSITSFESIKLVDTSPDSSFVTCIKKLMNS